MQTAYDQTIVREADSGDYFVAVNKGSEENPEWEYYVNVDNAVKSSSLVSYFDLTGIDYTEVDAKANVNNYVLKANYDSTNGYDNDFIPN